MLMHIKPAHGSVCPAQVVCLSHRAYLETLQLTLGALLSLGAVRAVCLCFHLHVGHLYIAGETPKTIKVLSGFLTKQLTVDIVD